MSQIFPIPLVHFEPPVKMSPTDCKPKENVTIRAYGDIFSESDIRLITTALETDEFLNTTTYREQVGVLCKLLRDDLQPSPLSYEKIGHLFTPSRSPSTIREQEIKYKEGVKQNGRPPLLTPDEEALLKDLIYQYIENDGYPTYEDISDIIIETFGKYLAIGSIRSFLKRMPDFKSAIATPLEETRYLCPYTDIEQYYDDLAKLLESVPIGWLYNLDETGQQDFVDARQVHVLIPSDTKSGTRIRYAVDRNGKRCTALVCISSDGKFLKPLFVLPRKTVDIDIFDEIDPDDVLFEESPTGFINTEIFCHWFDEVFIPSICKKEKKQDIREKPF